MSTAFQLNSMHDIYVNYKCLRQYDTVYICLYIISVSVCSFFAALCEKNLSRKIRNYREHHCCLHTMNLVPQTISLYHTQHRQQSATGDVDIYLCTDIFENYCCFLSFKLKFDCRVAVPFDCIGFRILFLFMIHFKTRYKFFLFAFCLLSL